MAPTNRQNGFLAPGSREGFVIDVPQVESRHYFQYSLRFSRRGITCQVFMEESQQRKKEGMAL